MKQQSSTSRQEKGEILLENLKWTKSSLSEVSQCVEVAFADSRIVLRDSKDTNGPVLVFTQQEWKAFVGGIQNGEFGVARTTAKQ